MSSTTTGSAHHRPRGRAVAGTPLKLRVHVVATLLLAAFVISLVAVFLLFALGRFGQMAEDHAREIFGRMADAQAQKLDALAHAARIAVDGSARFPAGAYREASPDRDSLLRSALLAAVQANPALYGVYFGLEDGSFFQVIGVRAEARVAAALSAPPGTEFAIRQITREGARATARWQFIDAGEKLLDERVEPSDYDPVLRPWYLEARRAGRMALTEPYLFQSSGELGLTLARPLERLPGVAGADLSLAALSEFVARTMAGQPGGTVVLDNRDRVLAFAAAPEVAAAGSVALLTPLRDAPNPYLKALAGHGAPARHSITVGGERQVVALRAAEVIPGVGYRVLSFAPVAIFEAPVIAVRDQILTIAALVLVLTLPLAYGVSRRASRALGSLASDSERIKTLDFSGEPRIDSMFYEIDVLGEAHRTMKRSIRERTAALQLARDKLASLVDSGLALSAERHRELLLGQILQNGCRLAAADAGMLYLVGEQGTLRCVLRTRDDGMPLHEIPLSDPASGAPNEHYVSVWSALHRQTVVIDDLRSETRFDVSGTLRFDQEAGYRTVSQLDVPLVSAAGEVLGVMQLANALDPASGKPIPFDPELVKFVEALAAQAALALDNHQLLEGQREMMDALIRIIAGAIDAKSAYTGGHCERVPELAVMLAEAACRVEQGPLAGFRFASDEEWREFRIGAWLHDCGKVTTPEYVVDKATKLETLYNRIHEIRTRFEVLLRDARVHRLEALRGGADEAVADAEFEARRRQLTEDFAFVAECNIGGESMAPAAIERLERIAGETWLRHFDDRLGLSHEEAERHAGLPPVALPATETLLADKPQHRIPRHGRHDFDPRYGFKVEVPDLLYNLGERYNLRTGRGTLTLEERFKINEHIIQTIIMLDRLPLPKNLRRVPEYAGTHHETLTGRGYPRGLAAGALSIPARIMAIADIFEALTASDRPYKSGKTLSEAVRMLARFCDDGHIDRDLFELFLTSGVHLQYARRYLGPDQIDEVKVQAYLSRQTSGTPLA